MILHRVGRTDFKGLVNSTTKEEYLRYKNKCYETNVWLVKNCAQNYKSRPDSILQFPYIVDMVFYYYKSSINQYIVDGLIQMQEGFSMKSIAHKPSILLILIYH